MRLDTEDRGPNKLKLFTSVLEHDIQIKIEIMEALDATFSSGAKVHSPDTIGKIRVCYYLSTYLFAY